MRVVISAPPSLQNNCTDHVYNKKSARKYKSARNCRRETMSIIELWFHVGLDPMAAEKGAVGIITRWKVQCTHEPCPKNTTGGRVWMAIPGGAHSARP